MGVTVEKTQSNPKYHFNNWQEGIADSPELGFSDIRNVEVGSFPGEAVPTYKPQLQTQSSQQSKTFTVDPATEIFTWSGSVATQLYDNAPITFTNSGGALPAPLAANTLYYVIALSTTTFSVSTKPKAVGGTALNITTAGTGTNRFSTFNMGVPKNALNYLNTQGGVLNIVNGTVLVAQSLNSVFVQDDQGYIWTNCLGSAIFFPVTGNQVNTTPLGGGNTYGNGNGIATFTSSGIGGTANDYLFACNGTRMEALDLTALVGGTITWYFTGGTQTFTTTANTTSHSALLGQDNKVYFCDGRYLTAFSELPTKNFSPTDATTFSFSNKVLTLPSNASSQCLEQLGINLLIGDANTNYIYPWDRFSTSFTLPLRVPENNIQKMINTNNIVYILAGTKGVVYTTSGYMVQLFKKIPEYLTGGSVTWGGLDRLNGHLLIGLSTSTGGNGQANGGVYKIFLHTLQEGTLVIDNTPDTGLFTQLPTIILTSTADTYFIGYEPTNTSGAIDLVSPLNDRYSNYESYIETPIVSVSGVQESRNFEELGMMLARSLTSGEGIQVSSRLSLNDTYSVLGTFTTAGVVNDFLQGNISDANALQLQIALKENVSGNNNFSPRLKEISIK